MDKNTAIAFAQQGKKITHRFFGSDEYLHTKDGYLVTEEGYRVTAEFWMLRAGLEWQQDWTLYPNQPTPSNNRDSEQEQATDKDLKIEVAEIEKQLKLKTLSPYTRKKLEARKQEISDALCGFTEAEQEQTGELFTGGDWGVSHEVEPDLTIWANKKIDGSTSQNECVATVWASMEAEANASLICEAPALYKMLIKCATELNTCAGNQPAGRYKEYLTELTTEAKAILSRINTNKVI